MALYSRLEGDPDQDAIIQSTTVKDSVDKYDSDNNLTYDGDSTAAGAQGYPSVARRILFIDDEEATLTENKERGLTAPGWWEYMTYTDGSGKTRHKAQHLVSFKDAPLADPDQLSYTNLDDAAAADIASTIVIDTQPVDYVATTDPEDIEFTIAVTPSVGSAVYQWQQQTASATTRWTNLVDGGDITGSDSDTLSINNATLAAYDGYKFRCKVTSDGGASEVTSNTVTVTYNIP